MFSSALRIIQGIRIVTVLVIFIHLSISSFAQEAELVLPVGHTATVRAARFSPDGKFMVSGGADKQVMVWQTLTGKLIRNLKDSKDEVYDVFFSPNGQFITALTNSSVYLWSFPAMSLKGVYPDAAKAIFSPDNKKIYIQSYDGSIARIGLTTMKKEKNYEPLFGDQFIENKYYPFDISRDSKMLLSTTDSIVIIKETETGKLLIKKKINGRIINGFFNADGRSATIVTDMGMKKLQLTPPFATREWGYDGQLASAIASNNRKWLLISPPFSTSGTSAMIWNVEKETSQYNLKIYSIYDTIPVIDSNNTVSYVTGTAKYSFPSRQFAVSGIAAVSNDGRMIRVGNNIWNNNHNDSSLQFQAESTIRQTDFSPDGKFALVQHEPGKLKLWDLVKDLPVVTYQPIAHKIKSAEISPDGAKMVVSTGTTARLIDVITGKTDFILKGHKDLVASMTFSNDGLSVLTNSYDSTAALWNTQTGKQLAIYKGYHPLTNPVYFSPDGKIHFTEKMFDTVNVYNEDLTISTRVILREREHADNLPRTYSSSVRFKVLTREDLRTWLLDSSGVYTTSFGEYYINISAFSKNEKLLATTQAFSDTLGIWDIENKKWLYTGNIRMATRSTGKGVSISQLLFSPDNEYLIVVDKNNLVHLVSMKNFKTIKTLPGEYCAVSANADKMLIIHGGIVDIYDLPRKEKLYAYIAIDSAGYLILDALKRYDGTEDARKLLYFSCGKEIIDLDQFKDLLWVPDLTERIMKSDSIHAKTIHMLKICGITPEVEKIEEKNESYRYKIIPRSGGIGESVVYVNGIEALRFKPAALAKTGDEYHLAVNPNELKKFFAAGSENRVTVKVFTADNNISSRGLVVTGKSDHENKVAPNLYAVMVGVSDYKGDELDLKYASKDAKDLSASISMIAKKFLNTDNSNHVFTYDLTTDKDHYLLPEKMAIKKTLDSIATRATVNDILLVFFAGHGVVDAKTKKFHFLTADASKNSAALTLSDVSISTEELAGWIKPQKLKAQKRVLIFDACNSGQAIKDIVRIGNESHGYVAARNDEKGQQMKAIEKLNEQAGLFILSASASDQNAYEMGRYSQGLLTYCLLRAIKEQPDILEEGKYLNLSRWFNAAESAVKELTKDNAARQQPHVVSNSNFNIGIVDNEVMSKIQLPGEKAMFTATNFHNNDESIADDNLELSKYVNLKLNELSARGITSQIVYVTATNNVDAYTLTGRYEIKENSVVVKINIKQGGEIKKRFEVTGKKDKLDSLAADIAEKAVVLVK